MSTSQDEPNTLYMKMVSILYAKYPSVPYNIYKFDPHFDNLLPVAFVIWMPFVYNHHIVRNICIVLEKTINRENFLTHRILKCEFSCFRMPRSLQNMLHLISSCLGGTATEISTCR